MDSLSLRYLRWYQYALELFPLLIFISFDYVGSNQWPPLTEFIILTLVIAPITSIILYRLGGRVAVYAAIPVVFLAAVFFGFGLIYGAIIAVLTVGRIENRYIKTDEDVEAVVLLVTFFASIIAFLFLYTTVGDFASYFIFVFAVQIITWLVGRLTYYFIRDEKAGNDSLSKKAYVILSSVGVITLVSYLLYVLFPYIKFGFAYVLHWGLLVFAWLMSPIFNMAENFEPNPPMMDEEDDDELGFGMSTVDERVQNISNLFENVGLIIIIAIVAILVILYIKYRNRLMLHKDQVREGYEEVEKEKTEGRMFFKRRSKAKRPSHRVRRAYYDLEKWAAKHDIGRREYETIDEWMNRLSLYEEVDSSVLEVYKTVRYKQDEDLDFNEPEYLTAIQTIKKTLKKKADEQKKSEE
ncbi:hypothetical protein J2R98_001848 [Alkalibacillus filiformis]|uniref:DUF4129 domain-containing protein n=1 Tax=Alkalibacillus filiformis TaxID=200990 RepID=A0ABU0DUQ9_9BACI|nr:hypothetical protein [Alkalibacillus filiformis]MDQ0352016.1 hypothetical protein [Alkalibacillus filiformis]